MNRIQPFCLLTGCCIAAMVAAMPAPLQKTSMEGARANRSEATIEGLVRDIACPMQNLDGDATHLSLKCVRECVNAGSPIGILTKDGELYLPISDKMPDYSQRKKLMPFVGKSGFCIAALSPVSNARVGTHGDAVFMGLSLLSPVIPTRTILKRCHGGNYAAAAREDDSR